MIKIWSIFNFFDPAMWIIQDGKESGQMRSDAYFPDWKAAFIATTFANEINIEKLFCFANLFHVRAYTDVNNYISKCKLPLAKIANLNYFI